MFSPTLAQIHAQSLSLPPSFPSCVPPLLPPLSYFTQVLLGMGTAVESKSAYWRSIKKLTLALAKLLHAVAPQVGGPQLCALPQDAEIFILS